MISAAPAGPRGRKSFFTWARWGRTGTAGQSQLWAAKSEADAVRIFEEKYEEKTGTNWASHASFVQQPGMYKLLRTDFAGEGNALRLCASLWLPVASIAVV